LGGAGAELARAAGGRPKAALHGPEKAEVFTSRFSFFFTPAPILLGSRHMFREGARMRRKRDVAAEQATPGIKKRLTSV
jgi:hypothetical protein